MNRNILHQTASAPALAESQQKIESQKTKDFLTDFFKKQISHQVKKKRSKLKEYDEEGEREGEE